MHKYIPMAHSVVPDAIRTMTTVAKDDTGASTVFPLDLADASVGLQPPIQRPSQGEANHGVPHSGVGLLPGHGCSIRSRPGVVSIIPSVLVFPLGLIQQVCLEGMES